MNVDKVRNVDEKARVHADRRRRCSARGRKDERAVCRGTQREFGERRRRKPCEKRRGGETIRTTGATSKMEILR